MKIEWFQELYALEKLGSFSKAAASRNLSQPAFTRRIQALEEWAETVLVSRAQRPVSLTPAGSDLVTLSLEYFDALKAVKEQYQGQKHATARIPIRFAAQHALAWNFFPSWLQTLEISVGSIPTRMRAEDLSDCLEAFMEDQVDYLIAYDEIDLNFDAFDLSFKTKIIGKDAFIPVSATDNKGQPLFNLDHKNSLIPLINYTPDSPMGSLFQHQVAPMLKSMNTKVIYQNSMSGTLLNLVLQGSGVCWLPERVVHGDLETGRLALAGKTSWRVPLNITLYMKDQSETKACNIVWLNC